MPQPHWSLSFLEKLTLLFAPIEPHFHPSSRPAPPRSSPTCLPASDVNPQDSCVCVCVRVCVSMGRGSCRRRQTSS